MSTQDPFGELNQARKSLIKALSQYREKHANGNQEKILLDGMILKLRDNNGTFPSSILREMEDEFSTNNQMGSKLEILRILRKKQATSVLREFQALITIVAKPERELDERLGDTARLLDKISEIDDLVDKKLIELVGQPPSDQNTAMYQIYHSIKAELGKESEKAFDQDQDKKTLDTKFNGTVEEVFERMLNRTLAKATAPKLGSRTQTNRSLPTSKQNTPVSTAENSTAPQTRNRSNASARAEPPKPNLTNQQKMEHFKKTLLDIQKTSKDSQNSNPSPRRER